MALVQWTESVGLTLVGRDQSSMQLRTPGDQILNLTILQVFPFTYESKRMGIIVRVSGVLPAPQRPPLPLSVLPCSAECASGPLYLAGTSLLSPRLVRECDSLSRKEMGPVSGHAQFNQQGMLSRALKQRVYVRELLVDDFSFSRS